MKPLRRHLRRYVRNLPELPRYLWLFTRCLFLFKRPIRMEYHRGPFGELSEFVRQCGFSETYRKPDTAQGGALWLERTA